jgi:hypothetical protein
MGLVAYIIFYLTERILVHFVKFGLLVNDICLILSVSIGGVLYFALLISSKAIDLSDIEKLPLGYKISRFLMKYSWTKS